MVPCTPHPGLGTVFLRQRAGVQVVDLATCRRRAVGPPAATISLPAGVVATKRAIRVAGRTLYVAPRPSSVEVVGTTPDARWILFAVDPMSSASLAADGLTLQAVRSRRAPCAPSPRASSIWTTAPGAAPGSC